MSQPKPENPPLDRRELLAYAAWFGPAFLAAQGIATDALGDEPPKPAASPAPTGKKYPMKKSINLWAFPYPQHQTLRQAMQLAKDAGFDAVELNYALDGDLSPDASPSDIAAVGKMARQIGLEISGLCSFLYWPYSLTANDSERRARGLELAQLMIQAANALETPNLLTIAGSVYIPWLRDIEPVPNDVCARRSREAINKLIPVAEKAGVYLNLENIFSNGFLFSPGEMCEFVDSFQSDRVRVHFDTGNIMLYQFPEHWIQILGKRIQNVHLKEYSKKVNEFNLDAFRPLLDGTTNWPAVLEAFEAVGYNGYLTFEYFHPYQHWPEALIYQTSDTLDRMLGRK
ncbi:MAG: sugar phosphate isomerase/epimerase [Planctomycetes bacterium]|nr:sugar phosphate isomerase/epimerase [Planctomycetota bacterium]